jgi:hypothetical protein
VRFSSSVAFCACITSIFAPIPLLAADPPQRIGFGTVWYIEPGPVADPPAPLKERDAFFEAKVFPHKMYVAEAALSIVSGKGQIAVGEELVGLAGKLNIGCTKRPSTFSGADALLLKAKTVHICLLDRDSDGRFDTQFAIKSLATIFLRIEGVVPDNATAIAPIPYHSGDPKMMTDLPTFRLFYGAHHSWVKEFSIGFGVSSPFVSTVGDGYTGYSFKDKEIPLSLELFGGKFRIEEMVKGRIRVKIEQSPKKLALYVGARQN